MPHANPDTANMLGAAFVASKAKPTALPIETEAVIECFGDLTPSETLWLWDQKLPLARLIVFSGNPDCGKSVTTCDLIARFTTGTDWPDGKKNTHETADVLMLLAEDDPSEDTLPRLMAAGADVKKVHHLKMVKIKQGAKTGERRLALDQDIDLMRKMLASKPEIKLIVLDPITGYFGNINMNKEQEIRRVLEPLRDLCVETRVTIIAILHFNKRSDVDVMHRVSGAVAITGVPRAVWAFGKDPEVEGEYLMTSVKGNKAKNKRGLRYQIEERMTVVGGQPVIKWLGESMKTAEDMVARKDPNDRASDKAVAFLKEILKDGKEQLCSYVTKAAESRGISESTLVRARRTLAIRNGRNSGNHTWRLETDESNVEPEASNVKF